jgi:UDP-galactopyranose mutase
VNRRTINSVFGLALAEREAVRASLRNQAADIRQPDRSVLHHTVTFDLQLGTAATVNFTDNGHLTRETDWSRLPFHAAQRGANKTVTREEPSDYTENSFERYYPVKTSDGRYQAVYRQYKALAAEIANVTFIGRCGTYQYLDMHRVINQSLLHTADWIGRNVPA